MASIRTGRASVSLLDGIKVEYYGTPTPLNQVANLHVPEPSLITVQPWDVSQIGAIEKAIRSSDLGLNPGQRRQADPRAHSAADRGAPQGNRQAPAPRGRGSPRGRCATSAATCNERVKKLLKDKLISEDDERRALDEIQKMTDAYIQRLDQAAKAKEKEILEIK